MQNNPEEILSKVLQLIGFEGDKKDFIDKFLIVCQQQALADLIEGLPPEKQEELNQKLSQPEIGEDIDKVKQIVEGYLTPEEYASALEKATAKVFQQFLQEMTTDLTPDQSQELGNYLKSLTP